MKAKLLVVEDSALQAKQTVAWLEEMGYEVLWARGGIEGLKLAKLHAPDLILLDVIMDDMDGYAVCRWLRVHETTRDIPIIMLTARDSVDDKIEGLNVGADDYLPKPFNERELEARILAILRSKTSNRLLKNRNHELEQMLHKVEVLAITDPLTGIYNRRRFFDALKREFATIRRYRNALSCLMADLDHFKLINDRHGHPGGDEVLKHVAQTMVHNLREVDVPARYGGEEFAILLPQTPKDDAVAVAERICKTVAATPVVLADGPVKVTISIGVAAIADIGDGDEEQLVLCSDYALYEAKARGRNCVVGFSAPGQVGNDK
jgi:diguanylate cyclase (GGDEF)-like protein